MPRSPRLASKVRLRAVFDFSSIGIDEDDEDEEEEEGDGGDPPPLLRLFDDSASLGVMGGVTSE